jgi:hypothetical protein
MFFRGYKVTEIYLENLESKEKAQPMRAKNTQ